MMTAKRRLLRRNRAINADPVGRAVLKQLRKTFNKSYGLAGPNNTFSQMVAGEAEFIGVQIVFANHTGSALQVDKCIAAPTATPGNEYTPSAGNGAFVPVTFGGLASGNIPAGSGAGNDIVPGFLISDIIPIASLPRSDGGTLPLLLIRCYAAGNSLPLSFLTNGYELLWPNVAQGRVLRTYFKSGDGVGIPGDFTSPTGPSVHMIPAGVIFHYAAKGKSIFAVGDSLTQGFMTTADNNGFGHQLCANISTPAQPCTYANFGYSGQTSAAFYENAKALLALFSPTHLIFPSFSPNDGAITQASCDASYNRAIDLADRCLAAGVIPILTTPVPYINTTSTTDAYRLSIKTRLLASGRRVADWDTLFSDGATPARIKAIYDSGDGTHLNDAAHAAGASLLAGLL